MVEVYVVKAVAPNVELITLITFINQVGEKNCE